MEKEGDERKWDEGGKRGTNVERDKGGNKSLVERGGEKVGERDRLKGIV